MEEPEMLKTLPDKPGPSKSNTNQQENDDDHSSMCLCGRVGITIFICLVTTFVLLSILFPYPYTRRSEEPQFTTTCNTTEEFQARLYKLTGTVHDILDKQSLRHFLCYDALWGALEVRGLLPWVTQVEICFEKEHLAKKSIKLWLKDFSDANLSVRYSWREGAYVFTEPGFEDASVKLILFKEEPEGENQETDRSLQTLAGRTVTDGMLEIEDVADKGFNPTDLLFQKAFHLQRFGQQASAAIGQESLQTRNLKRSGWNYFRLHGDCRDRSLECFHPYLVDKPPLRKKLFGELRMPVPHFNEAIQKQHYPDTWQQGSKGSMPKNC